MKTERITVLASPEFKAFLAGEAEAEGVSISELVRRRCERQLGKDEELLGTLAEQLRLSNAAASAALDQALAALDIAQAEMKKMRAERNEAETTKA
ncbi:MAG: hypothetical protein OZ927_07605 [Alcaligenaceae bacterium]|nr:hypothetical protein [Alcaligenaceae bacterium]